MRELFRSAPHRRGRTSWCSPGRGQRRLQGAGRAGRRDGHRPHPLGVNKPVTVLPRDANVDTIVSMTAYTVARARLHRRSVRGKSCHFGPLAARPFSAGWPTVRSIDASVRPPRAAAGAGCGSSGAKNDARDGAADGARDGRAGDALGPEVAGGGAPPDQTGRGGDGRRRGRPAEGDANATADGDRRPATGDATPDGGGVDRGDAGGPRPGHRRDADSKRYHAIAIALGSLHCARCSTTTAPRWGTGEIGQLPGRARNRGSVASEMGNALPTVDLGTGRTAKAITAGRYGTCALLDDDSVKCWGIGVLSGQFTADNDIGDEPNEMGDNLAPLPVGAGRKAIAVGLSYYTGCFARDDRSFRCWDTSSPPAEVPATTDGTKSCACSRPDGAGPVRRRQPARDLEARRSSLSATPTVTAAGGSSSRCALVTGGPPTRWAATTPRR
jgi:hypothetical protein